MFKIAHRGNLSGPQPLLEHSPKYIEAALSIGFDCEIDVWVMQGSQIYLGHDEPTFSITLDWISRNSSRLWLHCKNEMALLFFDSMDLGHNFFWHENDTFTRTSQGYIWAFPASQPISGTICVLPERLDKEWLNKDYAHVKGICTDYVQLLKK
jgi:hypothetical protein